MRVELDYSFEYWDEKNKGVTLRLFAGQNLFFNGIENGRYGFSLGGQSGFQDVTYEHYLFGRHETTGLWSNQRIENQGGFKTTSSFGTSTDQLFSGNIIVEVPYIPLLVAYADFGAFENAAGNLTSASDAGLGVRLNDIFAVYFPLYESANMKDFYLTEIDYAEKIRFTLNLKGFSLKKLIPAAVGR